ncbi:LytTR family DNA-binding domain-containing protein [Hymenobacter sp. BT770]|uniref:LytR/AlgR family response regulator transcription factor n=1 Tax=Hymenobacter sp. BT770 TaxID=2886942 RepID=UPI001D112D63|nr:LytTR family DNA-binding domain-containing protein [Hymenobacter sp. BT770]MCC3152462.1 LytTR family DNA-binding domain-containing protein [Hymenobacter sp. BT770]MDO3414562.1 LytTR family DNA-binding domain-containing protein [Hymenobacter sp. BT770]
MKDKLTCYIIEDEYLAQEILEEYISKVSFLELKGTFASPLEAAAHLAADKPDLLFLDINMPDLDGLSFIPMLNPKPIIILTTAYDQYALKAYDLEVKDYLLKPFTFERFYKGVLRLYQEQSPRQAVEKREVKAETKPEQEYLFLKVGHRIQNVATRDILFVEGMKDYLRIHTRDEKIMTLLSFARLEELLPAQDFARVHRSFLVAIDKIEHIEKNRIRIGDQIIPISDTYADAFYKMLKGL